MIDIRLSSKTFFGYFHVGACMGLNCGVNDVAAVFLSLFQ